MAKATDKTTTRRAVLTGAATLALSAQAVWANDNASRKALQMALQPSEHGRALLALLPALGGSLYRQGYGLGANDLDEWAEERCEQLQSDILDSSPPNLIDLAIVATFRQDWQGADQTEEEPLYEFVPRRIAEHLLELAGIDPEANRVQTHYDAYERSLGVTA